MSQLLQEQYVSQATHGHKVATMCQQNLGEQCADCMPTPPPPPIENSPEVPQPNDDLIECKLRLLEIEATCRGVVCHSATVLHRKGHIMML